MATSGFLDLPIELRLNIYSFLFPTSTFYFHKITPPRFEPTPASTSDSRPLIYENGNSRTSGPNPAARGIFSLLHTHPLLNHELSYLWISRSCFYFPDTYTFLDTLASLPTESIAHFRRITIFRGESLSVRRPAPSEPSEPVGSYKLAECVSFWLPTLRLDVLTTGNPFELESVAPFSRLPKMFDLIPGGTYWKEVRFWGQYWMPNWAATTAKAASCDFNPSKNDKLGKIDIRSSEACSWLMQHGAKLIEGYTVEGSVGRVLPEALYQEDVQDLCGKDTFRQWRLVPYDKSSTKHVRPLLTPDRMEPGLIRIHCCDKWTQAQRDIWMRTLQDPATGLTWQEHVRQGNVLGSDSYIIRA